MAPKDKVTSTIAYNADLDVLAIGNMTLPVSAFAVGGFTKANVTTLHTMIKDILGTVPDDQRKDVSAFDLTKTAINGRVETDKIASWLTSVSAKAKRATIADRIAALREPIDKFNADHKADLDKIGKAIDTHKAALDKAKDDLDALRADLAGTIDLPALQVGWIPGDRRFYVDHDTIKGKGKGKGGKAKRVWPNAIDKIVAFGTHKGIADLSVHVIGQDLDDQGKGTWSFAFDKDGHDTITGTSTTTANAAYDSVIKDVIAAFKSATPSCSVRCNVPDVFNLAPKVKALPTKDAGDTGDKDAGDKDA